MFVSITRRQQLEVLRGEVGGAPGGQQIQQHLPAVRVVTQHTQVSNHLLQASGPAAKSGREIFVDYIAYMQFPTISKFKF